MSFVEQIEKVVNGSEQRIDGCVVSNVVAKVDHRGLEERREPDRRCARVGQV